VRADDEAAGLGITRIPTHSRDQKKPTLRDTIAADNASVGETRQPLATLIAVSGSDSTTDRHRGSFYRVNTLTPTDVTDVPRARLLYAGQSLHCV